MIKEKTKLEYFPKLDQRINPLKGGKLTLSERFQFGIMKFMFPEIAYCRNGFFHVTYFKILNTKTGETKWVKEK